MTRRNATSLRRSPVERRVEHPYITRRKDTCGGKPIVAGTRIKVEQIAVEYERMGLTPDEIVQAHPHLTLAQVPHVMIGHSRTYCKSAARRRLFDKRGNWRMARPVFTAG